MAQTVFSDKARTQSRNLRSVISADGLSAGYSGVAVVKDLNLHVAEGEVVALLGSNGAGKTTTILALAGELSPIEGRVLWYGQPSTDPLFKRVRKGLRLITEERSVIMSLTVADNLRLRGRNFDLALEIFPELRVLLGRKAGLLSGGEQQMLTLGRALMGGCRVLLADELSVGLAPLAADRLLDALRQAASTGTAVILVEQQLDRALRVANRVYVFQRGRVVTEGDASYIWKHRAEVEASYLSGGVSD